MEDKLEEIDFNHISKGRLINKDVLLRSDYQLMA